MSRPGPRHGRRRGPDANPGSVPPGTDHGPDLGPPAPRSADHVQSDRPAPRGGGRSVPVDDQALAELPPDSPEATGGGMSRAWQAALLVWAGLFGFLLLYELISFVVKALR